MAWHYIPCPQQKELDAQYGEGFNCCVVHGETEKVDTSVFYYNREAANSFYKQKMIQYWEQEMTVINGVTGKEYCEMILWFPWAIDNVKIDSVCVFKGLYY